MEERFWYMDEYFWTKRESLASYLAATQGDDASGADARHVLNEKDVWAGINSGAQVEPYFYSVTPWVEDRVTAEEVAKISDILEQAGISTWWDSPIARNDQHAVRFPGDRSASFVPGGDPAANLVGWMQDATTMQGDGTWWSHPHGPGMVVTSRSLPFAPAVFLVGAEDQLGIKAARVYTASPVGENARVYEVASGIDWLSLLELAPAEVTTSRVSNWGRFDRTARWFLPDWAELSKSYDAVHLTVNAYLDLSGLPQECPGGYTMIVGWGPDETHWLNKPGVAWSEPHTVTTGDEIRWTRAPAIEA